MSQLKRISEDSSVLMSRTKHQETAESGMKPLVFYDGGCPLCRREIAHYQRLDRRQRLRWIDITRDAECLHHHGLTFEQVMRRFHVLDVNGNWQTGVSGFVEVWRYLPYYRRLGGLLRLLKLENALNAVYGVWAGWRLRRRCNDGQCRLDRY